MLFNALFPAAHEMNFRGYSFSESAGRINITLAALFQGPDLLVSITGGTAHIGAVALAAAGECEALSAKGHREAGIAIDSAQRLERAFNCHVAVAAGMHFSDISAGEISLVVDVCAHLTEKLIQYFKENNILPA